MVRTPLDVLQELRDAEVDRRVRALADQQRAARAADADLERALSRRVESERAHCQLEAGERERLEAGQARVSDLAAVEAWRVSARQVEQALCEREVAAGERAAQAYEAEAECRRELMERRTASRALSRYRERTAEAAAHRTELGREEEAADAWLSRRSKEEQ